jgi:hypothetical protein
MPAKSVSQKRIEYLENELLMSERIAEEIKGDWQKANDERGQAMAELADADERTARLRGIVARGANIQRRLLRMVYAGDLKTANLEGYISHVREAAAVASGTRMAEDIGNDVDYERDRLMNATGRQFGKIIDDMDPDVLDVVLGRPDEKETPF